MADDLEFHYAGKTFRIPGDLPQGLAEDFLDAWSAVMVAFAEVAKTPPTPEFGFPDIGPLEEPMRRLDGALVAILQLEQPQITFNPLGLIGLRNLTEALLPLCVEAAPTWTGA